MPYRISDLLDGFEDGSVDLTTDLVSATKIKELTMKKLNAEHTGKTRRATRRIFALTLAAALVLALGITAYAAHSAISTPQAAEQVAREQIEVWKSMGLLSPELSFEGEADEIYEFDERNGGDPWYGRIFPHHYDVRWFYGTENGPKYGCNLSVDTLSGRIMTAALFAVADESDVPVREEPITGENGQEERWYFYDNFEDIFPADMTVDRFCMLLAEYWGFDGYTLGREGAARFSAVDGQTLLRDIPSDTRSETYIAVYFDGDQEGVPMYIELDQYAGHVCLLVGEGHTVG